MAAEGAILPGSCGENVFQPLYCHKSASKRALNLTLPGWALTLRKPWQMYDFISSQEQHSVANTAHVVTTLPGMVKSTRCIENATAPSMMHSHEQTAAQRPSFDKMPVFLFS